MVRGAYGEYPYDFREFELCGEPEAVAEFCSLWGPFGGGVVEVLCSKPLVCHVECAVLKHKTFVKVVLLIGWSD